jgi:RNA-binding protein
MALTGKQRQRLRALAHHLDPVVQVGHEGITDPVVSQIDEALRAHELIKVKLGKECPIDRETAATEIGTRTASEIAQTIGRVIVLFRRRPKKPKVTLRANAAPLKSKGAKGRKPRKSKTTRPRRSPRPARSV